MSLQQRKIETRGVPHVRMLALYCRTGISSELAPHSTEPERMLAASEHWDHSVESLSSQAAPFVCPLLLTLALCPWAQLALTWRSQSSCQAGLQAGKEKRRKALPPGRVCLLLGSPQKHHSLKLTPISSVSSL